jgi:hypothetical protein
MQFFLRFEVEMDVNLRRTNTLPDQIFLMRGPTGWNEQDFPDHARIVSDPCIIFQITLGSPPIRASFFRSRSDRLRSVHHFSDHARIASDPCIIFEITLGSSPICASFLKSRSDRLRSAHHF